VVVGALGGVEDFDGGDADAGVAGESAVASQAGLRPVVSVGRGAGMRRHCSGTTPAG
jgi:hypothetical protein